MEKIHLSGRIYKSRSALGYAFHQFLMGVPKDEYKNCFSGLKYRNDVLLLNGNILRVTRQKKYQLLINISEKTCHRHKFSNIPHTMEWKKSWTTH